MRKLTAPKSVQIGAHRYKIQLIENATVDIEGACSGDVFHPANTIRISTHVTNGVRRSLSSAEEILWHEILHAISRVWNVDLDEESNERMAQGLTQVMLQWKLNAIKEVKDAQA